MKEFFERLPRAWKRFILLSVDLLFVPVALYFSFCLETNSLWPTQSLIENWSVFPVTISVAAIVSISPGIPSIRLNAFEARATIRTGVFATVIALFVAAISGMAFDRQAGGPGGIDAVIRHLVNSVPLPVHCGASPAQLRSMRSSERRKISEVLPEVIWSPGRIWL